MIIYLFASLISDSYWDGSAGGIVPLHYALFNNKMGVFYLGYFFLFSTDNTLLVVCDGIRFFMRRISSCLVTVTNNNTHTR